MSPPPLSVSDSYAVRLRPSQQQRLRPSQQAPPLSAAEAPPLSAAEERLAERQSDRAQPACQGDLQLAVRTTDASLSAFFFFFSFFYVVKQYDFVVVVFESV